MTTGDDGAAAQLDIAYLIAAFPQCFFLNHERRRPLKIGLFADLVSVLPFTEAEIQAVLKSYVRSDGYLLACTKGTVRIDGPSTPRTRIRCWLSERAGGRRGRKRSPC